MRIDLQRLEEDDWRLWRAVRLAALAEAPDAFGSTLAEWSGPNDLEARWRARLASVPFTVVAGLDDSPAGVVAALRDDDVVELVSLWVAPAARGRGVGDALVAAVLAWADGREVQLDVRAGNAPAITLYARAGFTDAGPAEEAGERRMVRPRTA